MSEGLHWIDGTMIAAYALGMLALGWHYKRQEDTDEYFISSRSMHPFLIGISLFATLMSTITYVSSPGEIIRHGPVILTGMLSIPLAYLVVGHVLIPVFMRYRVTSAYELLEARLGLSSRLVGATLFVVLRLVWMAVLLNFSSRAMLVMLGLDGNWMFPVTVAIGAVALFYSALGGLRAVVVSDLLQFLLLFGGAAVVVVSVTIKLGGIDWLPTSWDPGWDTQPLFSIDPHVRLTAFGVVLMNTLWWICTAGGDQTAIQRYMATRDARDARRSFLINSIAGAVVSVLLALVGLSLLGYFRVHPEYVPGGKTIGETADALFPHYISHHLPVGVGGLVVSGMLAAAMSSVDSGVNAITAVVMTDFIDRFRSAPTRRKGHVRAAKLLALVVGVVVIGLSTLVENTPGSLIEIPKRTTGLLVTPMFTLFVMALFVPFATAGGANFGALVGFAVAVLVAFWKPLVDIRPLSITWISPTSLTAGLVAGCAVSRFTRRSPSIHDTGGRQ